jgi:tetratricopeptide (TPR) repeat protein
VRSQTITRAIRLDPKEAFAYNDRGNAYLTKEDLPRAIADYTEAIRLNSKYVSPHIGFRLLYLNRNGNNADWDLAIADCREAIRLDPKNARAYYYRGQAQDLEKAVADYTEAIKLNPDIDASGPYKLLGKAFV